MLNVLVTEELRTDKVYRGEIQPPQETIGGENINDVIVKFVDSDIQDQIERTLTPELYSFFREAQRIPAYSFFPANGVSLMQGGVLLRLNVGNKRQAIVMSDEGVKTENVIPTLDFERRVALLKDSMELTRFLYENQIIHDDLGTHNTILKTDTADCSTELKQVMIDFDGIRTPTSQTDLEKSSIDFALILIGGVLSNTEIGSQKYHPNIIELIEQEITDNIDNEIIDEQQQDIVLDTLEDLMDGARMETPDGAFSIHELAVMNSIISEHIPSEMLNTMLQYWNKHNTETPPSFDTFYDEMMAHIDALNPNEP